MRRIQKGFFLFFCFVQQMAEQLIPVTDEQRHDLHGAWRDAIRAKVKQAGIGNGHEQRGMGGDDEL